MRSAGGTVVGTMADPVDPVREYLEGFGRTVRDRVAVQGLIDSMVAKARAQDPEAMDWLRKYAVRFRAMGYDIPVDVRDP
jgi:hypothetical protein